MVKLSDVNNDEILNRIADSFESFSGISGSEIHPLTAHGSARRYFRIAPPHDGKSYVAAFSEDEGENRKFIALSKLFRSYGINCPEVFRVSPDRKIYIQQDLGDTSLYSVLHTEGGEELVRKSLDQIAKIHSIPERAFDETECGPGLTGRQIMWDLNYFKYEFLKPSGIIFSEEQLEDDFERLRGDIRAIPDRFRGFMYRDFQSRNLMVVGDDTFVIDFQGGGPGPLLYDVVSFLWQARAGFSEEFRMRMLDHYVERLSDLRQEDMSDILGNLNLMRLFRGLQVLGAYGLRGLVEHKASFVESIPAAIRNLKNLIDDGAVDRYPELKRAGVALSSLERFKVEEAGAGLTVKIFSFSYKKGYPEDLTGNGGGFIFDCRGMTNPGRFEEYKKLTGLDKEVVDFLEQRGEVQQFVERGLQLVAPAIDKYIARGFSSLQIGFGCTGGQHRSVYCAERMGNLLSNLYPDVRIKVNHREQSIRKDL